MRIAVATLVLFSISVARPSSAQTSQYIGLAANGTCEVGTCPASEPLPSGNSVSLPLEFTVIVNGDVYSIVGTVSSADSGNSFSYDDVYSVQYIGNTNGNQNPTAQNDTIVTTEYRTYYLSQDGTVQAYSNNGVTFSGGSAGVAPGSTAQWEDVAAGVSLPLWSPPPYSFSGTANFNLTASGNEVSDQLSWTFMFAAGSPVGSYILLSGAPIPLLDIISPQCTAALNNAKIDVTILEHFVGYRYQARAILGSFAPVGGLKATALACGFQVGNKIKGFDWVQRIEQKSAANPDYPYKAYLGPQPQPTGACSALLTPPWNDPPQFGYCGSPLTAYIYPFYYGLTDDSGRYFLERHEKSDASYCPKEEADISGHFGDAVLCHYDSPEIPPYYLDGGDSFPRGNYILFSTSLVGIQSDGSPTEPLAKWWWMDKFTNYVSKWGDITVMSQSSNVTITKPVDDAEKEK